ncbi:MAG TPA: dTDP-4-dehydrorhamnose 3,5-epimerase family protein [Edaphocola sp.]|nr:dTDP-4-dehydrorhamnose 3,5-epimerase family protein [Edaphocola sp.]
MFDFIKTPIDGVWEIILPYHEDVRGGFSKVFHNALFQGKGIDFILRESYFSRSAKDVIRGMHFQLPPYQHHKIVYCPHGAIMDVALDLRRQSPSYGRFFNTELSAENHKALFIPEGCAHGFRSLSDQAMTVYLVSSEYQPEADTGLLWNSFGLDWQCSAPILSDRDRSFQAFGTVEPPF